MLFAVTLMLFHVVPLVELSHLITFPTCPLRLIEPVFVPAQTVVAPADVPPSDSGLIVIETLLLDGAQLEAPLIVHLKV